MQANRIIAILIFLLLSFCGLNAQSNHRISIQATSNKVNILDGAILTKGNWTLAPDLKPDVYKTDVASGMKKKITFYTDIDSISFVVEKNKTYDFNIILNKKDTCWTQISTIPSFFFSKEYIQNNKGKHDFEIPEVQELVHIIMALTPTGIKDENMVEHEGAYYNKVMTYFENYKSEPIIQKIDDFLQKGGYYYLKMDACGFVFNNDKIVKDGVYKNLSWDNSGNYVELFLQDFENFAQKTNFRKFYKENMPFYKEQIEKMKRQTPIDKQWKWLEKKFTQKYDHYRITFSPLVGGSHSANKFIQDDFKQTVMFICGPIENSKHNSKIVEGLMTRIIFTEIDHNYVNPTSDNYKSEIENSLKDIKQWATSDALANYSDAYAVFNEYMTWGVFTLYTLDHFSKKDFKIINEITEVKLAEKRGFFKFKEFNKMLLKLYKSKGKTMTIEELYPQVLKWCSTQ